MLEIRQYLDFGQGTLRLEFFRYTSGASPFSMFVLNHSRRLRFGPEVGPSPHIGLTYYKLRYFYLL